jgi:hypothetical protein
MERNLSAAKPQQIAGTAQKTSQFRLQAALCSGIILLFHITAASHFPGCAVYKINKRHIVLKILLKLFAKSAMPTAARHSF